MNDELEILLYGSAGLRRKSQPVEVFDDALRELVDQMTRAMIREQGIGLAAPQVDVHRRVLVAQPGGQHGMKVYALVNPEFTFLSKERDSFHEGCLSLPDITADVDRPVRVTVRYQDLDGKERELEDDGLLARIVQHEADHLEGILFVDHLSMLRRKLLAKKLKALTKRSRGG